MRDIIRPTAMMTRATCFFLPWTATDMALTTTSTYDEYGNVLSSVTTGRDVKAVTRHYDYDAPGRFVKRIYTTPFSSVHTFTYDLWGNLLTENDETDASNILMTTYTCDGWGAQTYRIAGSL